MRNAVIRKKRLKVERALEDFLRMPQRIMVPHIEVHADPQWNPAEVADRIARSRRNQAAIFGI